MNRDKNMKARNNIRLIPNKKNNQIKKNNTKSRLNTKSKNEKKKKNFHT